MIEFVTSMSKEGYDLYGKEFIAGWDQYGPCPLVIYSENQLDIDGHELRNLRDVPGFNEMEYATGMFPVHNGMIDGKYNYRYAVHRFFRKSFAQIDAATQHNGYLFWIDADVSFHKHIPLVFLEEIFSSNHFIGYLGRPKWHLCASFIAWDLTHEMANNFFKAYLDLYLTGKFMFLPEWHDSYIIQYLVSQVDESCAKNLTENVIKDGPFNVFDEFMGKYAHHKKGSLKWK